jgi:phosphatidate cytidylyltransferase
MHLKRWLSGLVLAPSLILFILYAPPWLFLLFILVLTLLGLREFYALSLPGISQTQRAVGMLLGLLFPLSLYSRDPRCFLAALAFVILFLFIQALFRPEEFPVRIEQLSKNLLGLLYVPLLFAHFVLIHQLASGRAWVLFSLVAVYFGDTTAFYIGRAWGRRKLAPQVSPSKTCEGGLGAMGGSLAGALIFKGLFFPELPTVHAIALGVGIGVVGQLGDLFESLIKRSAKVKDSGMLIPGHGGLLDRVDSLLFASPFVYYYSWGAGLG